MADWWRHPSSKNQASSGRQVDEAARTGASQFLDSLGKQATANLLPLPARNERGERWGEGHSDGHFKLPVVSKTALLSPAPSSLGARSGGAPRLSLSTDGHKYDDISQRRFLICCIAE